jgi:apolipoprotein D and lipocalin family protein
MITIVISSVLMLATKTYSQPLETVKNVDLARYAGKWYEISSFPQFFQKGCHCTTADYTYSDRGYLIVENRCNKDSIHGKQTYIKGKAFVVENSGNAKLDLQFFWPFTSKYWIIDLAEDYSYSVVSEPDKEYLWILSRKPKIDNAVYLQIISRLKSKGFDLSKLRRTEQI